VLCCIVLCCIVLCCTVLCRTVLCYIVLCCIVLCCTVLCCTVLYSTVLYCVVLYCCIVLCCTVLLYCTVLYCRFVCYVNPDSSKQVSENRYILFRHLLYQYVKPHWVKITRTHWHCFNLARCPTSVHFWILPLFIRVLLPWPIRQKRSAISLGIHSAILKVQLHSTAGRPPCGRPANYSGSRPRKYSVIKKDGLSLFAQIGDSSDKCSSSLEVGCWNEDETHAAQQSPTQF
jgi:hypothetical protein